MHQILLFVGRRNQGSLKIKNYSILEFQYSTLPFDIINISNCFVWKIFEMIALKWVKSLTNFYWLEMPKLHLRQPGFTYSACRPFTKHRERIQRFKKYILIAKIWLRELFQMKYWKNELMKLLYILNTMIIKED